MSSTLDPKDQMIAYLAAQGLKQTKIAEALGIADATVSLKLKDERMQFEIKHLRYKLYGKDHKKRFAEILPHAIDVQEAVILDRGAKPSLRLAAAQDVIDRALGKPKQTVEHEGSLIRALMERLDKGGGAASPEMIDGEVVLSLPAAPPRNPNEIVRPDAAANPNTRVDPIDEWAKDNL